MLELLETARRESNPVRVTSPEFTHEDTLPSDTGYTNDNTNPELHITDIPRDAESLVLTTIHEEAAEVVNHPWVHWMAWDIPVNGEVTIPRNYGN